MSDVSQEDRGRGACEGMREDWGHAPQGAGAWGAWSTWCEQGIAVRKLGREEGNAELGIGGNRDRGGWSRHLPVLEAGRHLVHGSVWPDLRRPGQAQ